MSPYSPYEHLGPLPNPPLQPSFTRIGGSPIPPESRMEPFDGFTRISRLRRQLPYRWIKYVLPALKELRNDPNLRARFYPTPNDHRTSIGPSLHYIQQVSMTPGAWLYGIQFAKITAALANTDFSVALHETNGDGMWSGFVSCAGFVPNGVSGIRPWLLSVPWQIRSGLMTVEIVNKSTTTAGQCQFVLCVLEPNLLPDARRTGVDTITPMGGGL